MAGMDAPRILIRLPNWLGDVLLARPLLHALRASRPDAEIRLVGPGPLLAVLEPDAIAGGSWAWPKDSAGRRAVVDAARRFAPAVALVLPPSFSSAWFAFRSGAPTRIGYAHEGRSWLLTRALRRPMRGELHLSREYLRLGESLGAAET